MSDHEDTLHVVTAKFLFSSQTDADHAAALLNHQVFPGMTTTSVNTQPVQMRAATPENIKALAEQTPPTTGIPQRCPPGCCGEFVMRMNLLDNLLELHLRGNRRLLPYNAPAAQIAAATDELDAL